jgi:aminoglycoside phosphotransferase (APT) family kinase protein
VLGGLFSADEIVVRYQQKTGLDCSSINWYRALASFRIAVILQQIYIRYARGQTTDERFSALGAVVGPIAAAGLDQLAET